MRNLTTIFLSLLIINYVAVSAENEFSSKTIHIGVVVSDIEKSLKFYKDVIGMVQVDQTSFDVNAEFGKKSGLTGGLPFHVEVLKLSSGDESTQWKLMSFDKKSKKQENEFIQNHTGVQYITILVAELKPIVERIKKANVPLLGDTPHHMGNGRYFVLVKDPDGTFIELIGPMEIK